MKHTRMSSLAGLAALLTATIGVPGACQTFTGSDWLHGRGGPQRRGSNGDPGLDSATRQLGRVWVYPATRDLPAEIVVDNTTLPPSAANATGQAFEVAGAWTYPAVADRAYGAWPPSDQASSKLGDYVYAPAVSSAELATLGTDILAGLPVLGTDSASTTAYRSIHNALKASTNYARWTFGTAYPTGTKQGLVDVGSRALQPNQRYAVYIRFPSSGTTIGADAHPNLDHAMVRVSWGSDPDDPIKSRIFMVDFGQTGGTWIRIRAGSGDDRYFPYDGTNPIRVTLYAETPDAVTDTSAFPYSPIIVADAVRLVPEALRGEIHAPAVSAVLPAGDATGHTAYTQLTYFGRDETTGPAFLFPTTAMYTNSSGFGAVTLDPSTAYNATTNPIVADPTSSIRSAVFYCMQDDVDTVTPNNGKYGKLRWRYVARTVQTKNTTIDDADAGFSTGVTPQDFPVLDPVPAATDDYYGVNYRAVAAQASAVTPRTATWRASLPEGTYSVYAWIPGAASLTPTQPARKAHYAITTLAGTVDVWLDQRNTSDSATQKFGTWRLLTSGVHFIPATAGATVDATVVLDNVSAEDAAAARSVVADAVQFVAESQTSNSVVASPLVADVAWPSGVKRKVVYFGTTDGHLWALDALGVGGQSTLTTPYWVYPSVASPDPTTDLNSDGLFNFPQDDPNFIADPMSGRPNQAIDGDITPARQVGATKAYTTKNVLPDLGAFTSSPIYVETEKGLAPNIVRTPYIVVGNANGRLYAFDPVGRVSAANEPFALTISAGDVPGVPGTTRRLMTWPTTARDKWLDAGGLVAPKPFSAYNDDAHVVSIASAPAAPKLDAALRTDRVVIGAGDGHVYAVDLQGLDTKERISNPTKDGAAIWQFPESTTSLAPVMLSGALTTDDNSGRYIFSAGGRVYCVRAPDSATGQPKDADGYLRPDWVYPYAVAPGNPAKDNDAAIEETDFTAPAYKATVHADLNGGNPVAFVANKDGRVFALDATPTGNPAAGPTVLWQSASRGSTRASAVYLDSLPPQIRYGLTTVHRNPAVILPLETGGIVAFSAVTIGSADAGIPVWSFGDASVGSVPLTALGANNIPLPAPVSFPTSSAGRGADAITANTWAYSGDDGNPQTGEPHGQMRAYWRTTWANDLLGLDMQTPDEPEVSAEDGESTVSLRGVEVWNAEKDKPAQPNPVWEHFGDTVEATAKSGFTEWAAGHHKPDSVGDPDNMVVYEWGDTIYTAAWGVIRSTAANPPLPTVTFRLFGSGQSRPSLTVGSQRDVTLDAFDYGDGSKAYPWVAKIAFPLGRGSEADAQTPGRRYTVYAQAQLNSNGINIPSLQLAAGQSLIKKSDDWHLELSSANENKLAITDKRTMAIAHPLAVSTRGTPGGAGVGPAVPNVMGWTLTPSGGAAIQELLANGNNRYNPPVGQGAQKDMVAPLGLVGHGGSATYVGVDAAGNRRDSFLVADRSNLYKLGQALNNLRVERRGLGWTYNKQLGGVRAATGDVMNPLPWESFPTRVPNVSKDYPDMDASRVTLRVGSIDIGTKAATLPNAWDSATSAKRLNYVPIDLSVQVPKFQPANVSAANAYEDINGNLRALYGPMRTDTGQPATSGLFSPSAGYVGRIVVFVDNNGDGKYQGAAVQTTALQTQTQTREEVYRSVGVGLAVSPDLNMRTEEETIDLGRAPHGAGLTPTIPFLPSGVGPYVNTPSPFDSSNGFHLFAPFTVRNQGNVNLTNLRVAKAVGNAATASNPLLWPRLNSDQVSSLQSTYLSSGAPILLGGLDPLANWRLNTPLVARAYPLPIGAAGGAANLGVVSSLDHARGNGQYDIEIDWSLAPYSAAAPWPFSLAALGVAGGNPYVPASNPLGWAEGVNAVPTLHKARPGDGTGTTLSIPDVSYGDPLGVLATLRASGRDVRPRIGIAPPVGAPVGTYTGVVNVFEDAMPLQWREWTAHYATVNGGVNPLATAADNDGILNLKIDPATGAMVGSAVEPTVQNPFQLRLTVSEARLTNAPLFPTAGGSILQTDGTFPQIDLRVPSANNPNAGAFGANLSPSAARDRVSGAMMLVWSSNRPNNAGSAPERADVPWSLLTSQLTGVSGALGAFGPLYGWRYEQANAQPTRWWQPLAASAQFPGLSAPGALFPSETADIKGSAQTPVVPGAIVTNPVGDPLTVHSAPALVQTEGVPNPAQPLWLFWQGAVNKTAGAGMTTDSRTFYAPVRNQAGVLAPDLSVNNGVPYSFLNDPALPKYSPRPLLAGGGAFLFWHGGASGRTRLYYNVNTASITTPTAWSADAALPVPGGLQMVADPVPVPRRRGDGNTITEIDVVFTGQYAGKRTPEMFLTRYNVGDLMNRRPGQAVRAQARVTGELMVRQGATQTWQSRDVAWIFRDPVTGAWVDGTGNSAQIAIYVNGSRVNVGTPTYDSVSGKLYFNSTLGGRLVVNPQSGAVTFTDVAPGARDAVTADYTPRTLRLNVTRSDSGVVAAPAGWGGDPGYAAQPHVVSAGANTAPVAFIDRAINPVASADPSGDLVRPGQVGSAPATVSRMWVIYRKTGGSESGGSGALFTKTMRLAVRLPRPILRSTVGGALRVAGNVTVAGNRGPVEIDWIRGRLYFTEVDEGQRITVTFNHSGGSLTADYVVGWVDELSVASTPADQTSGEALLPTQSVVNEGQVSAFKDPFQDKVWVFWSSTRAGTTDLYYMAVSPSFYPRSAY